MKDFLKKLGKILGKTWVWSLFVVLSFALLIWFIGPLLAVADNKFWESPTNRLLSISLAFLLWGLLMVFTSWRSAIRNTQGGEQGAIQARIDTADKINEEQKELRGRFQEAVQILKTSSLYQDRSERWRNELPWYLVIGPKSAGKTSLLDFSGLDFPLNKIERKLTRDTQGTRYCDWYFANNAVLIDTAGRYLTQEDDVAMSAWATLLAQLRRRRRSRPLNGILVTIDVKTLGSPEPQIEALARQVRQRLKEAQQRLHVNVPVYLILTKADEVPGFDAFFDQLSRQESEQVFGASFRKEQNGTDAIVLRAEFDGLLHRLNDQMVGRLHAERDVGRRGLILEFPNKLAELGDHLCLFVDMAFTGSRYQRASQLRGFYLTSAPRLTEKMDDDAASIGAKTGMSSKVLPTLRAGRSRFIHQLLSRVIFPEAELAGLDSREKNRIHWRHRALYGGALLVLGGFALAWAHSFSTNHDRLEKVRELAVQLTQKRSELSPQDDEIGALRILDTSFEASKVFPATDDIAHYERNGLYQGEPSNRVLTTAYRRDLENQLLPRIAVALERQIRSNLQDREQLLGSLRAYLMLNLGERRDSAWLKDWVASDWSVRYSGNTTAQNGLGEHLQRLLDQPFTYPLDSELVTQARQILRGESIANVVYRALRDQAHSLPAYRLGQHLGSHSAVFSGADYVIPGFFTQQGYQQNFVIKGPGLVTAILRDNWVLGEGANISDMDLRRLMVELEQLYFRDYANHWSEAVGRIRLQRFITASDGADQLASLTAAHSPLLQVLTQIRDNTRFQTLAENTASLKSQEPDKTGALGKIATAAAEQARDAVAKALPDTAKKSLQRRFEPLHGLLDENNGPAADLLPALQALNELQMQLSSLARSSQQEQAAYDLAKARMSGQRDSIGSLRNASRRLPAPINGWLDATADDTWTLVLGDAYHYLNQRYQSELLSFYGSAIDKRYPFNAHSTSDVALNDFREFFKVQGVVDRFFDSYMRPFVSGNAGSYRLRSVDGRSLPMSRVFLEQMTHAHVIRQGFFAENPSEPQVQFKLEPYTLDPGVSRAEFRLGNQQTEYRHGPITPASFKWPDDAQEGRASLVLEKIAGRALGIEENTGPWSLFRLFDVMQTEYLRGRDIMVLKANVGGLRVNYLLSSQRSPNPFDLSAIRRFRLLGQL
jgi:type VI secretion system protein ImpL